MGVRVVKVKHPNRRRLQQARSAIFWRRAVRRPRLAVPHVWGEMSLKSFVESREL
jgi:hypothetical protein